MKHLKPEERRLLTAVMIGAATLTLVLAGLAWTGTWPFDAFDGEFAGLPRNQAIAALLTFSAVADLVILQFMLRRA